MKIICLSHILNNNLSCYNNEKSINISLYKNNELLLNFPAHSSTHIDFPLHVKEGGKSLSDYNIKDFIFYNPYVLEVDSNSNYIQPEDLKEIPDKTDLIIIKLLNTPERYSDEYATNNTGVGVNTVKHLKEKYKNLRAIGINSISINAYKNKDEGRQAHKELLLATPEILIIEDMKLNEVSEGELNRVIVSPLLIANADGVPVTVIAEVNR